MDPTTLQLIWFALVGVLMAGYAILDGFDLGVGILHLFGRGDTERRIFMNSIGPLWDGNEVWLVVFGGALFAAFPGAYAAAFSGFYTACMQGLPLGGVGELTRPLRLRDLLLGAEGSPLPGYPIVAGLFAVAVFAMHG